MRSAKTSAMATSRTGPEVLSAWLTAPLPRPPQPMNARRIKLLPAAWAMRAMLRPPAVEIADTAPFRRNCRREQPLVRRLVVSLIVG